MTKLKTAILVVLGILLLGILIGWFWCKSTFKPIVVLKPGKTIKVTEWKTNTITKRDTIYKYIQVIKWKDNPIYVYPVVDTLIPNKYSYKNFLVENGVDSKDLIAFDVLTLDNIKVYTDTTFDHSYLDYKLALRVTNFVYKPAPIKIKPRLITSKVQLYGSLDVMTRKVLTVNNNIINKNYEFIPFIGISAIIALRYKFDIGAQLDGVYLGVGVKFLDWK